MQPEQQQRIMGYFIEEAKDHLNTLEQGLLNLHNTLQSPETLYEVFRAAHSIKGGAAMLGITGVQKTAGGLEECFQSLKERAVKVDEELVFLLMRVFDALKELLNQLTIPGGLQNEVERGILLNVEPVLAELKEHLQHKITGSIANVERAAEVTKTTPLSEITIKNRKAIQQIFQKKIMEQLRQMLQLFKQPDTPEVRQQLKELCHQMGSIGEEFDLPRWSELLQTSQKAIANPSKSLNTLAGIVIKEIKQGRELMLTGRFAEVSSSPALKALLPTAQTASPKKRVSPASMAAGEVGMARLDSVADMFEGETAALDENWQKEEIIATDNDAKVPDSFNLFSTSESYFSELMLDNSNEIEYKGNMVSKEDDFMSLFGDYIQSSAVGEKNSETETLGADDFSSWFGNDDMALSDNSEQEVAELLDFSLDGTPSAVESPADDSILNLIVAEDAFDVSAGAEESWTNWFAEFGENDDSVLMAEENTIEAKVEAVAPSKNSSPKEAIITPAEPIAPTAETGNDWEWDAIDAIGDSATKEAEIITPADNLTFSADETGTDMEWDAIDSILDGELPEETQGNEESWDFSAFDEPSSTQMLDLNLEETHVLVDGDGLFAAEIEIDSQITTDGDAAAEEWNLDAALSSLDEVSTAEEDSLGIFGTEADIKTETAEDVSIDELWDLESESVPADAAERIEALFDMEAFSTKAAPELDKKPQKLEADAGVGLDFDNEFLELEALMSPETAATQNESLDDWELNEELNLETNSTSETDIAGALLELEALMSPETTASGESLLDVGTIDTLDDLGLNEDWGLDLNPDATLGVDADEALRELESAFNIEETPSDSAEEAWESLGVLLSPEVSEAEVNGGNQLRRLEALLGEDAPGIMAAPETSVSEVEGVDELDELEGLLGSPPATAELDELEGLLGSPPATAELDELEGLLGSPPATAEFDDLEGLLGSPPATAEFDDLEGLLGSPPATAEFDDLEGLLNQPAATAEFDELEGLLGAELPSKAASAAPAAAKAVDDGFGDLEELLKGTDKFGGMSATQLSSSQERARVRPERKKGEQTMRVPVKQLDNLSNLVGELVVNRNSLEQDQERMRQFLDNVLHQVQQLSDVGARMQDLYERSLLENSLIASRQNHRNLSKSDGTSSSSGDRSSGGMEYDPLEMDRFTPIHLLSQEMIELIVRVRESTSDIEFLVDETDGVARQLRQITTQLQEGLTRSRMVPFSNTADRLQRVRDNAYKYGKQVELIVEGRDTLLDKMILEHLTDPLNHMLNNAIAHGIETPEVREANGKPPVGKIVIRAFHQGNQTVISVEDDGAGINTERVKLKAIEKGLVTRTEARAMSKAEIYELLFHPGFSTKDEADQLAGRGVGMDVVLTELNEIRGAITTESHLGKGTTFTIRLPLNLSIGKALCCVSNKSSIAFPMDGVEDMMDVPPDRIQTNEEGERCIPWRDSLMPLRPLSDLLKYNRQIGRGTVYGGTREDDLISIVVLRSAGNFLAVEVDNAIGEQEIVIKQLQGPVPKPVGIAGATVLGDGHVMPIADVLELIDLSRGVIRDASAANDGEGTDLELEVKSEPMVLIIDDSITVRTMLSMTFNKAGYRVEQARDGQEAWDKLRSGLPCDIVFCDIEMPRMDGLTLLGKLQQDESLKHLPVAMLTSRGAERHRQVAAERGARGYFTKPYLEDALLDGARRMMEGEVLLTSAAAVAE